MEDDGGALRSDSQNETIAASTTLDTQTKHEGFQYPALRQLTIDGRNFHNAGRKGPSWSGMLFGIRSLTVSHFRPRDGESLTISDFMIHLKPILRLFDLTIIDLQIESPLPSYEDMRDVTLTELKSLDLRDLECSELIDTIISAATMGLKSTTITRCVISDVNEFTGRLHLEGIKSNFWEHLQCWHGKELLVSRCPGFNDDTLEEIGIVRDRDSRLPCAPRLCTLVISDCPNISAAGLKQFVRDRRSLADSDGHVPLRKLFVFGDVPHISSEDRLWFTKKLSHFGYRGPELDLDFDSGSTVDLDGPGTDSDDSVYESDASVSDTSSAVTNYGL
jgi:hypothetical protein